MTTREEAQRLADALDAISAYSDSECATLADAAALLRQWPEVGWMPIESAPKGRKVLAGYTNRAGKWRTVTARYYLPQTLELDGDGLDLDDDGYAPEGWYEESESQGNILPTDMPPTHWMPLPPPPGAEQPDPPATWGEGHPATADMEGNPFPDAAQPAGMVLTDAEIDALQEKATAPEWRDDTAQGWHMGMNYRKFARDVIAAPAAVERKPLTDEQIWEFERQSWVPHMATVFVEETDTRPAHYTKESRPFFSLHKFTRLVQEHCGITAKGEQ